MGKLIDIDGLSEFKYKLLSMVGANSGIAGLDSSGKVPSSQLPSYVDDVLEYAKRSNFPATGEAGKIYVDLQKNDTYRWGGSSYIQITNGSLDATLVASSAISGASTVEQALTSLNDNVTRSIYLELPVTLAVANWSSSSPYTYTVTDSRIDNAVGVEVEFNDGTSDTTAPYISYEKVSGGVQFTSTVKPTASIGVTIKLNQSKTEAYTGLTADMVASEAVQNTENVEEALTSLSDQIATKLVQKTFKLTSALTTEARDPTEFGINPTLDPSLDVYRHYLLRIVDVTNSLGYDLYVRKKDGKVRLAQQNASIASGSTVVIMGILQ